MVPAQTSLRRASRAVRKRAERVGGVISKRAGRLAFERRMGVKTDGVVGSADLGYADERLQPYEASGWQTLHRALPKSSVSAEDVFVDLGSGMGRVVLRAAEYPFKRVVGVEMSPDLHAVAVENLERWQDRLRCGEVDLVCADVLEFEFPDDATVVFLYNPFQGEVFDRAMQRVFDSFDRAPRHLRVLYRNPVEHQRLMASGRVRVVAEWKHSWVRGWPRRVGVITYEVLPRTG